MKPRARHRRRNRNVFIATGFVLVILGIAVFIVNAPSGESGMKYNLNVKDSATNQPVAGATLFVFGKGTGGGPVPLANVLTDSSGSASIVAPSSLLSVAVFKQGHQEYSVQDFPFANTYVIHLGVTNATSSIEAINSTLGWFALPSPGYIEGAIVIAAGVAVLAVTVVWESRKSHSH